MESKVEIQFTNQVAEAWGRISYKVQILQSQARKILPQAAKKVLRKHRFKYRTLKMAVRKPKKFKIAGIWLVTKVISPSPKNRIQVKR